MVTARATRLRSEKYSENIHKRGKVPKGRVEQAKKGYSTGAITLAFLVFVLFGSAIFQVIRSVVMAKGMMGRGDPSTTPKTKPGAAPGFKPRPQQQQTATEEEQPEPEPEVDAAGDAPSGDE